MTDRRRIVVFDVNETLLDVGALAPQFERAFGDRRLLQEWFTNVVLYSQTLTIAGPYTDFGGVARACLDMMAQARGVTLEATDRDDILRGLVSLPAHADVRAAGAAQGSRVPARHTDEFRTCRCGATVDERGHPRILRTRAVG